jgi:Rrf2 family protein
MKISTKGCYGVRAMIELGRNFGQGPMLMGTIAQKQNISRKYLHALLTSLRTAGLVRSIRGSGGGYELAKDPSKITVEEMLKVLEGSLAVSDCVHNSKSCERSDSCMGVDLWSEITSIIQLALRGVSLEDIIRRQNDKDLSRSTQMYFI